MNLLKSNFRISLLLPPGEPLAQMIACCTEGFRRYSPMFTRDFVSVAFAIPYHRNIPMDKYLHLSCLLLFPVDLVITRYPENILCLLPCSFCHLNTPKNNLSHFRVSAHPQLFRCFTKVFEILFNPPKILSSFIALQILVYLHYGCFPYIWQYSLVSFDTVILNPIDSTWVWMHTIIGWSF